MHCVNEWAEETYQKFGEEGVEDEKDTKDGCFLQRAKCCFSSGSLKEVTCLASGEEVICIPRSAQAKGRIPLAKIHRAMKPLQPDAASSITSSFGRIDVPRYCPEVIPLPPFGVQ
ncbi:hypothetical protein EK904_007048 [Melospiza melodia maxima]|nr:hypothetical protein EK904_007048 [Melospiza melodia maxima]